MGLTSSLTRPVKCYFLSELIFFLSKGTNLLLVTSPRDLIEAIVTPDRRLKGKNLQSSGNFLSVP